LRAAALAFHWWHSFVGVLLIMGEYLACRYRPACILAPADSLPLVALGEHRVRAYTLPLRAATQSLP
jgi:hypothetical protein